MQNFCALCICFLLSLSCPLDIIGFQLSVLNLSGKLLIVRENDSFASMSLFLCMFVCLSVYVCVSVCLCLCDCVVVCLCLATWAAQTSGAAQRKMM